MFRMSHRSWYRRPLGMTWKWLLIYMLLPGTFMSSWNPCMWVENNTVLDSWGIDQMIFVLLAWATNSSGPLLCRFMCAKRIAAIQELSLTGRRALFTNKSSLLHANILISIVKVILNKAKCRTFAVFFPFFFFWRVSCLYGVACPKFYSFFQSPKAVASQKACFTRDRLLISSLKCLKQKALEKNRQHRYRGSAPWDIILSTASVNWHIYRRFPIGRQIFQFSAPRLKRDVAYCVAFPRYIFYRQWFQFTACLAWCRTCLHLWYGLRTANLPWVILNCRK